ncbi:hypothetical protein SDC9_212598 [bioreactor metagenome]|uniref:Uncharacterized protein n=1 Tax=bioreactor metagenome TaxID=1076179 RepID=A0A645JMG3_9ZZZZ
MAQHVVELARIQNVVRFAVVGAKAQAVAPGQVFDVGPDGGDVFGNGGIARVHIHARPQFVQCFAGLGGLVAGGGAADVISADQPPKAAGQVAL